MLNVGDTVKFEQKVGKIVGFTKDKYKVEFCTYGSIFSRTSYPKELIDIEEKRLTLIQSVTDLYYIMKNGGKVTKHFTLQDLKEYIPFKDIDKIEVFEVRKLGKPEITIGRGFIHTQALTELDFT